MSPRTECTFRDNPFANALYDYLHEHNISAKTLAYTCHISPTHISRFMSGRNMPSLIIFARICTKLELNQAKILSELNEWFIKNGSGYPSRKGENV
jgi:transcriptional regulator with XRE-family HTH domain